MSTDYMNTKKQQRKSVIEEVAFSLFCEKGIKNTSVDEIVEKADIAKGTFYLYFKNKQMLIDNLILKEAINVIQRATSELSDNGDIDKPFEDKVVFIIDYIIEYFKKSPTFLEFIHKGLYMGIIKEENRHHIIDEITRSTNINVDVDSEIFEKKLYLIFELVGSVIYNAILLNEPYKIDEIQVMLHMAVKNIVKMPVSSGY